MTFRSIMIWFIIMAFFIYLVVGSMIIGEDRGSYGDGVFQKLTEKHDPLGEDEADLAYYEDFPAVKPLDYDEEGQ